MLGETVGSMWHHRFYDLGYKVQILCVSDGVTTIPVDFSIHREKGETGDCGLTQKERRKQLSEDV